MKAAAPKLPVWSYWSAPFGGVGVPPPPPPPPLTLIQLLNEALHIQVDALQRDGVDVTVGKGAWKLTGKVKVRLPTASWQSNRYRNCPDVTPGWLTVDDVTLPVIVSWKILPLVRSNTGVALNGTVKKPP